MSSLSEISKIKKLLNDSADIKLNVFRSEKYGFVVMSLELFKKGVESAVRLVDAVDMVMTGKKITAANFGAYLLIEKK